MSEKKLKTAVLGLNDDGLGLLEAAVASGLYEITAVADRDPEIVKHTAEKYECRPFEDFRQLVVRNDVDVLFATAPIHLCADQVKAAMKKKINVLKLIPPALNFEQAAEFFASARKRKVRFALANTSRFSPGFEMLNDYLKSQRMRMSDFHLITAVCHIPNQLDDVHDRWLSDPRLAGGGVVLRSCYELIDQIVLHFGIPQQVYSLNTNHAPDRQQRLSITEDTALLTMKFTDTLMATLVTSRTFGPAKRQLCLHSPTRFITASEDSFTVCDNSGNVIDESKFESIEAESTAKMLQNFAASILSPGAKKRTLPGETDLNNMAVIESAYLSARTSMPEEPARLLQIVRTEPTNWKSAAKKMV